MNFTDYKPLASIQLLQNEMIKWFKLFKFRNVLLIHVQPSLNEDFCVYLVSQQPNQQVDIDTEEDQSSKPDPHESVVAFELQQVGKKQPHNLQ